MRSEIDTLQVRTTEALFADVRAVVAAAAKADAALDELSTGMYEDDWLVNDAKAREMLVALAMLRLHASDAMDEIGRLLEPSEEVS